MRALGNRHGVGTTGQTRSKQRPIPPRFPLASIVVGLAIIRSTVAHVGASERTSGVEVILVGDVAHPFESAPPWTNEPLPWRPQPVAANLEGALNDDSQDLADRVLFSRSSVVPALKALGVEVALLANNHVLDLPHRLDATVAALHDAGITAIGAGGDSYEATKTAGIRQDDESFRILNFGWRPIGCSPAGRSTPGTNRLDPKHVLSSIEREVTAHPGARIVVTMHWNYEMELYPQPAHRQLAFACIDAGADLVVGHHPHRVGGSEMYGDRLIVYSLGNFWLPQGVFFDGNLSFAEDASLELALEWHPEEPATAHWFRYDPKLHQLVSVGSEPMSTSEEIARRTPFSGMNHAEYGEWFKAHRVKRRLLPVYGDYRHTLVNASKDLYVRGRHMGLLALEQTGLRRRLSERRSWR